MRSTGLPSWGGGCEDTLYVPSLPESQDVTLWGLMTVFLILGGLALGTDLSADQRLLLPSHWQGFWATGTRNHLMSIIWIALPRCEPMSTSHGASPAASPLLPGPDNPDCKRSWSDSRSAASSSTTNTR